MTIMVIGEEMMVTKRMRVVKKKMMVMTCGWLMKEGQGVGGGGKKGL